MIPIIINDKSIVTKYANSVINYIKNNTDRKIANLNDIENAISTLSSGTIPHWFDLCRAHWSCGACNCSAQSKRRLL